jgi:CPA2 family monovalent cation:H+ antiporter-2
MVADAGVFRDLAYVFLAAVVGGWLARLVGQPLVLGYVVGGILVGPLTPGPSVSDVHTFELLAEIGVILLMFSVGIELSLKDLLQLRRLALAGVPLGMATIVGATTAVGWALGWRPLAALALGMVISVQSTMVAARLLVDRGELGTRHGRVTIGILIAQDLVVVVLIILLPALGALEPGRLLTIAKALGTAALILVPFVVLARKIMPHLLLWGARLRNEEMFLMLALAIAAVTAAVTQAVGLSLALGAFLAGILISESDYAHETLARLLPLRDTFVAFFFITVGILVDPKIVVANLGFLATIVGLVVVGNLLIWTVVVRLTGESIWTAALTAVWLTQIGEFSFVLVQVARRAGHLGADLYNATLAASLLTILVNAILVQQAPRVLGWLRTGRAALANPEIPAVEPHVIVCGFGRVGSTIGEALETFDVPFVAVDSDPDVVRGLRVRGVPCLFGDASRRTILEAAGIGHASLVVLALPDVGRAELAVRAVRALNPRVPVLARAHNPDARDHLVERGATEVIQPELEAAATLVRHSLERLAVPRARVLAYLERYRSAVDTAQILVPPERDDLPYARDVPIGPGAFADRSLRAAAVRERFGALVLTVTRADGEFVSHPTGRTVLRPGDHVRVFGLREQLDAFAAAAAEAPAE